MTVAWVYGGILVAFMAIFTLFLIKTLRSLQTILESMRQLIETHENQVDQILHDIEETLYSVKNTASRVDETIGILTAIPNSASHVGKFLLNRIFGKKD